MTRVDVIFVYKQAFMWACYLLLKGPISVLSILGGKRQNCSGSVRRRHWSRKCRTMHSMSICTLRYGSLECKLGWSSSFLNSFLFVKLDFNKCADYSFCHTICTTSLAMAEINYVYQFSICLRQIFADCKNSLIQSYDASCSWLSHPLTKGEWHKLSGAIHAQPRDI